MNLYSVHLATAPSVHAERRPARILLFERQIVRGQEMGIFRSDRPLEELTATVSVLLAGYTFHCETLSEDARARMLGREGADARRGDAAPPCRYGLGVLEGLPHACGVSGRKAPRTAL